MGVKHFWEILQDVSIEKQITYFDGERIAIDLATWICEAENVVMMKKTVIRPYLRNLFFRILKLTRLGAKLVFVTDGTAPHLKWGMMAQRLNARSDGSCTSFVPTGSRTALNRKFKECCTLLDHFGIPWIKSEGEAEATCAALNMQGLVDACATNDGDAFLYGARKVYRNLSCQKGLPTVSYHMKDIEEKLHLDRNCLISLALLLGCDYVQGGVPRVGKVHALKLLASWRGKGNPLDKMRAWKNWKAVSNTSVKLPHCSYCKHAGTKRSHTKDGCSICSLQCKAGVLVTLPCTCAWHLMEEKLKETAVEDDVIKKAKQIPEFPQEEIINEFLRERKLTAPPSAREPSLDGVVKFLADSLQWKTQFVFEKTLPFLTYWILHNPNQDLGISLLSIIRKRVKDTVGVYEIEWSVPSYGTLATLEERRLVKERFPNHVKAFEDKMDKDRQEKKTTKKNHGKGKETKMTDFYKIKKSKETTRNEAAISCKKADADIISISESLSVIDLTESPASAGIKGSSTNASTNPFPKSALNAEGESYSNSKCTEDVSAHCITSENVEGETQRSFLHTSNRVSFDLDFSLGQSLARSPDKENAPPSTSEGLPKSIEPTSPMFMTLAERLKQRSTSGS